MELQQLRYFLQICEDKNFSTAAQNQFVSQQALRKSMKKFEDEIGSQLVYRSGHKLCLTPLGESMRSHAIRVLHELDLMQGSIEAYKQQNKEYVELTVVMSKGAYEMVVNGIIEPYQRQNSHVEIKAISEPDLESDQLILDGVSNFGFVYGPHAASEFDVHTVLTEPMLALVNVQNPLAKKKTLTINDFRHQLVGIANERFKIFYKFCSACRQVGFEPNIDFRSEEPYSVHRYSHLTKNVVITAGSFYEVLMSSDQVCIPIEGKGTESQLDLVVRKGASLNRETQAFIDYAKQMAKQALVLPNQSHKN